MTPPIWFLDIDGVINSVGTPQEADGVDLSAYRSISVSTSSGTTWPITYSTIVVDFINEMSRKGLAEVRWLTTWEQDARLRFAPAVGLDEFPSYDDPQEEESPMSWWKGQIVADELFSIGRPFVWTDDDLDEETIELFSGEKVPLLLIAPDSRPGLTPEQLESIRAFLSGHELLAGSPDTRHLHPHDQATGADGM